MSVWTAMSAGLQIVQGKIDQALGEEVSNEQTDSSDLSCETSNQSDSKSDYDLNSKDSLQKALKESEQQNHLLNLEYGRLLREKEEELSKLREQVQLPQNVIDLQTQLREKEQQLKELSLKAETKFNKLKTQAKAKIAALTEELEKAKGELSINQETFDISAGSVTDDQELLRDELLMKTEECNQLKLQLEEKETKWKIKINKEHDSSQKILQEATATFEVERSKLLENIESVQQELLHYKQELRTITSSRDEFRSLVEKETDEKSKLAQQVSELMSKLEENEKRMTRDFSFASSEFQVVSSQVSQADSEEEWKVIRASGSSSDGKECSPPPEIVSIAQQEESPGQRKLKGFRATPELVKYEHDATIQNLESQLQAKEKEILSLKEQLERTTENKDTSNITLQSYSDNMSHEENIDKSIHVAKLTEENERLNSQLSSVREVVSEMEEELAEKSNNVDMLRNQLHQLETDLSKIKNEISNKVQMIKALESEKAESAKALQEERNNLDIQLKKIEKKFEEELLQLKSIIEEKNNEIETIVQEGAKKNDEITQLTQQLVTLQVTCKKEVELVREQFLQEITTQQEQKMAEKELQLQQLLDESEKSKSTQIKSLQDKLSEKDKGIARLKKETSTELEKLSNELSLTTARLNEIEVLRIKEQTEREQLKKEVNRLTESSTTFSADSAKCRENILVLEEQLSTVKQEKEQLSHKLDSTLTSKKLAKKELKEVKETNSNILSELERYRNETGRMNSQFSSAVDLLKQENQKLQNELIEITNEKSQLHEMSEVLREQIAAEGDRSVSLKEENKELKMEIKTFNAKCASLEEEKHTSLQKISELTAIQNQLQMSLETSVKEKEFLDHEHKMTLETIQTMESKVMELTNEIVTLVRDKETVDNTMRQLQRNIASLEKEKDDTSVKVESLQNQSLLHEDWYKEKESLTSHMKSVQTELFTSHQNREKLETRITQLESDITSLEEECSSYKDALSTAELERNKGESEAKRIAELETMLSELRQSHITEQTKLQVLVDTEKAAKLEALEQYYQLQRQSMDFVINIDDTPNSSERASLNTISDWIQRFIKKPNVVLMRLVRATPQTILMFLVYFIVMHLLLLYLIFS